MKHKKSIFHIQYSKFHLRGRYFWLLLLSLSIIVSLSALTIYLTTSHEARAAWYNQNWEYRKSLNLTNSTGGTLANIQREFSIDTATLITAGKMQSNCADMRFTNIPGQLLPYYIDSGCNSSSTKVWVLIDNIPTSTSYIYMYYGNPSASIGSTQNGFDNVIGLQGYWTFNEGAGTTAYDSTVNANNATINIGALGSQSVIANAWTNGSTHIGNALMLDGTDDWIQVPSGNNSLNITGNLTIEGWVNTSSNDKGIVSFGDNFGGTGGYLLGIGQGGQPSGTISFDGCGGGGNCTFSHSTSTINDGSWHFFAVSLSGTTVSFYIDGLLNNTDANHAPASWTGARAIGALADGSANRINGKLDDIKVYSNARSASQISNDYNNLPPYQLSYVTGVPTSSTGTEEVGPGPVGFWKFDDGTGTSALDSGLGRNNATLSGISGTATGTQNSTSLVDSGASFTSALIGDTVYLTGGTGSGQSQKVIAVPSGTTLTVSGWTTTPVAASTTYTVGPSWQTEDQCISGKCLSFDGVSSNLSVASISGAIQSVSLWVKPATSSASIMQLSSGTGGKDIYATNGTVLTDGITSPAIYVNGKVNGVITANQWNHIEVITPNGIIASSVVLGKLWRGVLSGFMDEVKLYPYARTAAQVMGDYNARGSSRGSSIVLGTGINNNYSALNQGLVGYWKMDEATWSGTLNEVIDSSGNNNHGQAQGPSNSKAYPSSSTAKFGSAGAFDGIDNYVQVPTSTSLHPGDIFTLSAWVKRSTTGTFDAIIGAGTNDYQLAFVSDHIKLSKQSVGDVFNSTSTYTDTTNWHSIIAVKNGNKAAVYYDGVAIAGTYSNFTIQATGNPINIGSDGLLSDVFAGAIDEVRIYNRALSPADIQTLYNYAPGPVAYYNFEEGSGSNVNDKSGNGNNGTWNGTLGSQWTQGKFGWGGNFNGTDNYVSESYVTKSNALTVSAWFKVTGNIASGEYAIVTQRVGNNNWALYENNAGINVNAWNNAGTSIISNGTSTPALKKNTWYHVAYTITNSNAYSVYINGQLYFSGTGSGVLGTNATGEQIGNDGIPRYFPGLIDDVKIYNYALSQKQVIQDMNAGVSTVSVGGSKAGPIGYWKFDEGYGTTANNAGNEGPTINGTLSNASGSNPAWTMDGKFGKALNFNGTSSYVSLPNSLIANVSIMTFSAWFKTGSTGSILGYQSTAVGVNPGSNWVPAIYISSDGKLRGTFSPYSPYGTGYQLVSSKIVTDNTWHYVVLSMGSTTQSLYLDGALVGSNTNASFLAAGTYNQIGAAYTSLWTGGNGGWLYFNGLIDDVKIYSYPLTQQEVNIEYTHNSGISMSSFSTNPNSVKTASSSASAIYCVPGDTTSCAPPVGEWNFEEGQGATVNDTSGNGNTGTWAGTGGHWGRGLQGWSGNFDGTDDVVNAGSGANLTNLSAMTISAWIYHPGNSINTCQTIAGKNANGNPTSGWSFELPCGYTKDIWFEQDYSTTALSVEASNNSYIDNAWQYITVTWDGSTTATNVHIYVNGVEAPYSTQQNAVGTRASDAGQNLTIGNDTGTGDWFNGKIDQVRMYNYVRTPAQIAWDYNRGGPVGWWKMDECQGNILYDSSGNGDNAPITVGGSGTDVVGTCLDSTASLRKTGANGKFNESIYLDGVHDYAVTASNSPLAASGLNSNFSIGGWVNLASSNVTQALFFRNNELRLRTNSSGQVECAIYYSGGFHLQSTTIALPLNSWQHIFCTHDSSTIKIYINGLLRKSANDSNQITTNSVVSYLGTLAGPTNLLNGQIDDVRLYNYPLTATQVKILYNHNSAFRDEPVTGTP